MEVLWFYWCTIVVTQKKKLKAALEALSLQVLPVEEKFDATMALAMLCNNDVQNTKPRPV